MSGKAVAPLPSVSSHGGVVVGNSGNTYIESGGEKPILLEPAFHICPLKDHGITMVAVSGFTTVNGAKVARVLDICGCGAYLISKADNTTSE